MIDEAGQSEVLRFVGVGDVPCQRPPFPKGIVSNSQKLSGYPECDRNEATAGVEEEEVWRLLGRWRARWPLAKRERFRV
jgi:hypothetical protein